MEPFATPNNVSITVAPLAGEWLVSIHHRISDHESAQFTVRVPKESFDLRDIEHSAFEKLRHWASVVQTRPAAGTHPQST
jgi:hypothetical protein